MDDNKSILTFLIKWKYPLLFFSSFFVCILIIFLVISAVLSPLIATKNFFNGLFSNNEYNFTLTSEELSSQCANNFDVQDVNSEEGKTIINYCRKLYYTKKDYFDEYSLLIDTNLITATLFYGRYQSDFEQNGSNDTGNVDSGYNGLNGLFSDSDFNKKATSYIELLAKYQVVRSTENSSCTMNQSEIGRNTIPLTNKEIAEKEYVWNNKAGSQQITTNKINYFNESGGVIDPSVPGSCAYEDDKGKIIDQFKAGNLLLKYNGWVKFKRNDLEESKLYNDNNLEFTCGYERKSAYKNTRYSYAGCSSLPYKVETYRLSTGRESVYYYKLMTDVSGWFGTKEDSFLSKYYDYIIKDSIDSDINNDVINQETMLKVVEGIYMMYDTVMGGSGSSYSADGDYASWSQKDPRWAHVPMGVGGTIAKYGCAMTSMAILIARSGATTTISGEFNPGTLVQSFSDVGGIDAGSYITSWDLFNKIAPGFNRVQSGGHATSQEIADMLNRGLYIIVKVLDGAEMHWVAIDKVENGIIYMNDPAFMKNDKYPVSQDLYTGRSMTQPYNIHVYHAYEYRP